MQWAVTAIYRLNIRKDHVSSVVLNEIRFSPYMRLTCTVFLSNIGAIRCEIVIQLGDTNVWSKHLMKRVNDLSSTTLKDKDEPTMHLHRCFSACSVLSACGSWLCSVIPPRLLANRRWLSTSCKKPWRCMCLQSELVAEFLHNVFTRFKH